MGFIWTDSTVRMVDLGVQGQLDLHCKFRGYMIGLCLKEEEGEKGKDYRRMLKINPSEAKNIFSPPARDVGYEEVAFLTTEQTTVSSQEAILTRICVYFPRSIRTIGLSWEEIHFKENWRNCFIFIYLFQQTSQQQPQWMQAAWQPQVKGRCSLAFPYLKLSLLSRAMQCTWHMRGCPTNASSLLCAHFLLYSSLQGKVLTEKEEAKPLSVLQIII